MLVHFFLFPLVGSRLTFYEANQGYMIWIILLRFLKSVPDCCMIILGFSCQNTFIALAWLLYRPNVIIVCRSISCKDRSLFLKYEIHAPTI